jgi:hypothetical protein
MMRIVWMFLWARTLTAQRLAQEGGRSRRVRNCFDWRRPNASGSQNCSERFGSKSPRRTKYQRSARVRDGHGFVSMLMEHAPATAEYLDMPAVSHIFLWHRSGARSPGRALVALFQELFVATCLDVIDPDVRIDELRRHQSYGVPQCLQLPNPVVGAAPPHASIPITQRVSSRRKQRPGHVAIASAIRRGHPVCPVNLKTRSLPGRFQLS